MSGTTTVNITVSINGSNKGHVFNNIDAKDARFLADHLIEHALKKINSMMPEDPALVVGGNSVHFEYVTKRDSDGAVLGSQTNDWPSLDDTAVGAIQGVYDAAMASLDKRVAAHGKKK